MPLTTRLLAAAGLALVLAGAHPAHAQRSCGPDARAARRAWAAPLDRAVTLRARDIALGDALDRVSAAGRTRLSYASDLLPLDRRVCLALEDVPLGDALQSLVGAFGVAPTVMAGQVVLVPSRAEAPPRVAERVDVLEGIVVTGTPSGGARRGLAIAMDAASGRSLERRGAAGMAQILNASAPGVWAWSGSPSSLLAQYASVRGASSFGASYPKVYVDGVEAANPLLLSEIDPETVERVEVIRGPQGAALYGSDAISGVVNIVTRHSAAAGSGTRIDARSRGGFVLSDFAGAPLPTHEQRVAVRTGSNLRSAGVALGVAGTGAIFPGAATRRVSAGANARWVRRGGIGTVTLRVADRRAGTGPNPLLPRGAGALDTLAAGVQRQSMQQYTIGASATLAGDGRWTHAIIAGADGYRLDHAGSTGPLTPLLDSAASGTLRKDAGGSGDRGTLRASSTVRLGGIDTPASGTLALALEHSVLRQRSAELKELRHNSGAVAQASGTWRNVLFATAGLRAERNQALAGGGLTMLPMLGAAWVHDVAGAEVKVRAAYGRGIRPAWTPARAHLRAVPSDATPSSLDPEAQSGIEVGAELYAGTLSLHVTRFDQIATGLIQDVALGMDTAAATWVRYELQNVGAIANRGWEMKAALGNGPLTITGTLALVDSRVRRLAEGYRGDLRTGDRMLAVPARTATVAAEWERGPWSASLTAARARDWINYDRLALASGSWRGSGGPGEPFGVALRGFWREYGGSTDLRATVSRELGSLITLTVAGDNLLGRQLGEPDNATIRPGRTLTLGLRARF